MMKGWSILPTMAVVAVLIAGAALYRGAVLDPSYNGPQRLDSDATMQSPGPEFLQAVSFQHPFGIADLLWLGIVQDIGLAEGKQPLRPKFLYRWADMATDFDPHYFVVYHATAINLIANAEDSSRGARLLRKGRQHLPDDWRLPFLLGYSAYFLDADVQEAADLWQEAAQMADAPSFVLSLASRARYQVGRPDLAERLLEDMIPHLDGVAQHNAKLRLLAFQSEPILSAYDEACLRYRETRGSVSNSTAKAIYELGWVQAPPVDLMGGAVILDQDCISHTEFIRVREHEALRNIGRTGDTPAEVVAPPSN